MQRIEKIQHRAKLFVFDLEFIGDIQDLKTCHIWEIAVFSLERKECFSRVVDPDSTLDVFPVPPIPEIPRLTREFLTQENAISWKVAFRELCDWISIETQNGAIPVFISHNTFRADKPVLELECRRYECVLPYNWYFFDSLHYSRDIMRNRGNYSLSGLHEQIFNTPIQSAHRAEADVTACVDILGHLTNQTFVLNGPIYPAYATSLRSIRWVGRKAENTLVENGILSTESLFMVIYQNIRFDYIHNSIDSEESVQRTLQQLLSQLPVENITNITDVVNTMLKLPFSLAFM